jgi:hypothetical protein
MTYERAAERQDRPKESADGKYLEYQGRRILISPASSVPKRGSVSAKLTNHRRKLEIEESVTYAPVKSLLSNQRRRLHLEILAG